MGKPRSDAQNSRGTAAAPRKKVPGRPFKKGDVRINKGGRPPIPEDAKEALKAASPEAVGVLIELMRHSKSDTVRQSSAMGILERVFGRVAQPLELTGKDGQPININGENKVVFDVSPERVASLASLLAQANLLPASSEAEGSGEAVDSEVEPLHPAKAVAEAEVLPPPGL